MLQEYNKNQKNLARDEEKCLKDIFNKCKKETFGKNEEIIKNLWKGLEKVCLLKQLTPNPYHI